MADFEPERRELCPDGACVGIIGPDGRCKECGTISPNAVADPRHRGLNLEAVAPEEIAEDLQGRELCPDGACIGVVGPDGRCKECGKPGKGPGTDADSSERLQHGDAGNEKGDTEEGSESQAPDGALLPQPEGWEERRLCPDDTCTGVLGADGQCPVCGLEGDEPDP